MITGSSLYTIEFTQLLGGYVSNVVPTITSILMIVIPIGLTLFGIGFAIKTALHDLEQKARDAFWEKEAEFQREFARVDRKNASGYYDK